MKKKPILTLFFTLISASYAISHPHIFLKHKIDVVFDNSGISGFSITLLADDFSTAGLTDGYDENENGLIDKKELILFESESRENLKQYNYFTHIKLNGRKQKISRVEKFKASLKNRKIEYSFFLPAKISASTKEQTAAVAVYDSSYFSFISFDEKNPVSLTGAAAFIADFTIDENKNESYYFNMINPFEMRLRFRKK